MLASAVKTKKPVPTWNGFDIALNLSLFRYAIPFRIECAAAAPAHTLAAFFMAKSGIETCIT
ncbi:MAG TPA: hypothetical protein VL992_14285 [Tepidisphaeraceae bacterium]|nr:hypothetical protein [Tepidisphaeraceae bacterium]